VSPDLEEAARSLSRARSQVLVAITSTREGRHTRRATLVFLWR
jgi:hypothetical protein